MGSIVWFKDIHKADIPTVGGKGANLGEMTNAGFPIPGGFMVTAQTYFSYVNRTGIQKEIIKIVNAVDVNDTAELQATARKIQETILGAPMLRDIADDIKDAYAELNKQRGEQVYVAARSSATAEDLPSISEDEYVLVKINGKPHYGKMKEIYEKTGNGKNSVVEIPTMQENKVKWNKVKEVYVHPANNDKLYKIKTITGKEITLSPNHSVIVLDEEKLEPKVVSVSELKGNEKVPTTASIPEIDIKQGYVNVLDYIHGSDVVNENNTIKIKNNSTNWKIQNSLIEKIPVSKDFAYFLGIYCAEGSTYGNNCVMVTNSEEEIMGRVKEFMDSLKLWKGQKINKNSLRVYCKPLVRFLHKTTGEPLQVRGKGKSCKIKKVPDFIFGFNKELIGEFLKGCFDGDGYVAKNGPIQYTSTSEVLIVGIIKLLEILGIRSYLQRKKHCMTITVPAKETYKFKELVGFESKKKSTRLDMVINEYENKERHFEFKEVVGVSNAFGKKMREELENNLEKETVDVFTCPNCSNKLRETSRYKGKHRYICKSCRKTFYEDSVSKKTVEKYIYYDEHGRFKKECVPWNKGLISGRYGIKQFKKIMGEYGVTLPTVFDGDVSWDQISTIEPIDYSGYVYDFVVPEVENFAAGIGGIITHNTASFAGQQATFLDVQGEGELIKAVRKCWASLYTPRAIFYRVQQGFAHDKVGIAVVVQEMIKSEVAGVMFTSEPTGQRPNELIIEGAYGLGEAVVGGKVTPDTYVIEKKTDTLKSKKISTQKDMIVRNEKGLGTVVAQVPPIRQGLQKLPDGKITELAAIGKKIEEHYGAPQDIEWAVQDGELYILQSRAITTLQMKKEEGAEAKGEELTRGLGASPGVGSGIVKVIHSMDDLPKVQKDDILVTEMTTPDMVPAMQRAAAIVTDEGGITCIGKEANVLTDHGFMTMEEVYDKVMNEKVRLKTLSLDSKTLAIKWRRIQTAQKRKADALLNNVFLQPPNTKNNTIAITPDHKMVTIDSRKIVKKELERLYHEGGNVLIADKIPPSKEQVADPPADLMYLSGAMFSDGSIAYRKGRPIGTRFTQKAAKNKTEFINRVTDIFREEFGAEIKNYCTNKFSGALEFSSNKKHPAEVLHNIKKDLVEIASTGSEEELENFIAGFADGDGHINKEKGWLELYFDPKKEELVQALVIAFLRLGIGFRVRSKKNCRIMIVQNSRALKKVLQKCSRIKPPDTKRMVGEKLFSARGLVGDIRKDIDWRGNLCRYVKNDILIDINKLEDYVRDSDIKKELKKFKDSDLTERRIETIGELKRHDVYNLTIDTGNELDHNYVVFTSQYTPVIVGNCHAAIVSRELGIPCIVGTENITELVRDGDKISVDASHGVVYKGMVGIKEEGELTAEELASAPKTKTHIYMNLGVPEMAEKYKDYPVDGIGLMREEFIIATYVKEHPLKLIREGREQVFIDKLVEGISKVASAFAPRPVVLRTSDFKTNEYRDLEGGEEFEPEEDNPMIGWRGASRYHHPDYKEAFRLELKAIRKAREQNKNIWIMLPFVRTVNEIKEVEATMKEEGLERGHDFKLWMMAEIPSNAILAEEFADYVDGFSIGSNDLTQLVLGVDRDSEILGKMGLFDEKNEAVKKAIKMIIDGAHKKGKTVSLCGQAPSNYPEFAKFLVEAGIDSMSINPDAVVKVRKVVAEAEANKQPEKKDEEPTQEQPKSGEGYRQGTLEGEKKIDILGFKI